MTITTLILGAGSLFSIGMAYFGAKLRYGRAYGLVAGYNTASEEEKKEYDIEGLADHLGSGLMTMAVLLLAGTVTTVLGSMVWSLICIGLFVLVAFLVVVGGRKFLPNAAKLGEHRLLKAIVSERTFEKLRAGTKEWLLECPCGYKSDLWEEGGVRGGGLGEPRQWMRCRGCERARWLKVRRKTELEKKSVA